MPFSACSHVLGLVTRGAASRGAVTRGFPKENFGKSCSETFRRLQHRGLQASASKETAWASLSPIRSVHHRKNSFLSPSILQYGLFSVSDALSGTRHRNFSTTKPPLNSGFENVAEAVNSNDDDEKGNSKNAITSQELILEEKNSVSKRLVSAAFTPKRNTGKVSTVIEPIVRRKPFQNFRHSVGSNNKAKNSNDTLRKQGPATKRIFVDNSLMNKDGENHPNNPNRQQQIRPSSTTLPIFKPGDEHGSYPVIAIQVARSIDLSKVISQVFASKGVRKMRERLSVVAQLQPNDSYANATPQASRFVAVFRFGSVVFFNVSPKEIASLVEEIKQISTGSLLPGKERKDRFCVHVQPPPVASSLVDEHHRDEADVVTADYCIVPELNMKSVDVISNIMAQSVALDAYNDTVDELLADFERINNKVTSEGKVSPVDRDKMFRAVAQNNAIFLKLTKVGIKDRVDTAWNLSQYENVSEGMRDEFDIDRRFEHIEFKLNLIQQNAKFFLEVLANQKSDSLEWIIIVLILLECVLMCVEMSGMGEPLFAYLGEFLPSRPSVP